MASPCRRCRGEDGVFLVIWALLIVAIFTMVAIVIDLGALRADRRMNRAAADAAATAGANDLGDGPSVACATAIEYAAENLRIPYSTLTPVSSSCSSWATCDISGPSRSVVYSGGSYEVTVTNPVAANDPIFIGADAVGGDIPQVGSSSDGVQCNRLGVSIKFTRPSMFGRVVQNEFNSTTSHSVALTGTGRKTIKPSLVVLEPTRCPAISANGNGSIEITGTSPTLPGGIIVVSDGSACGSGDFALDTGMASTPGHITVSNPGSIHINAMSGPTCSSPACNPTQFSAAFGYSPYPEKPELVPDRSLVDYRFNCKANYSATTGSARNYRTVFRRGTSGTIVPACTEPEADYVNKLFGAVAGGALTSAAMTTYPNAAFPSCASLNGATIAGPARISCAPPASGLALTVNGDVWFSDPAAVVASNLVVNGNAVFSGGLTMSSGAATLNGNVELRGGSLTVSGGTFRVRGSGGGCSSVSLLAAAATCVRSSSSGAAFVFLGTSVTGITFSGGTVDIVNTAVFMSGNPANTAGPVLSITGGGNVTWSAPTEGPFNGLMAWSDKVTATSPPPQVNTTSHNLGGTGTLNLTGVFFSPTARVALSGTPSAAPERAQFWAGVLQQLGNGIFRMTPDGSFVDVPVVSGTRLIR